MYQLRAEPPGAVTPPAAGTAVAPSLQLLAMSLPELLERDAILVPQGRAGVQALAGHRWAEPLRDGLPRVLRQDLARVLGVAQVWVAPVPAGVAVRQQLRLDVLSLQADEARRAVTLQVRWTLIDSSGAQPALTRVETVSAPVQGADVDAIAVAHRLALWRLAEVLAVQIKSRALP